MTHRVAERSDALVPLARLVIHAAWVVHKSMLSDLELLRARLVLDKHDYTMWLHPQVIFTLRDQFMS